MRCTRPCLTLLPLALLAALTLGGCPTDLGALEVISGGARQSVQVGGTPSMDVLAPSTSLTITGGTQVEVSWRATAPSRFSVFNVIVDPDTDPNNGNEIYAFRGLPLTTTSVLVDTTRLQRGTYNFGVTIEETSAIVVSGYAPGKITIDQRPNLFFTAPQQSVRYDRSPWINPTINVAWSLSDPDSTDTVEILLDPDDTPSGNEVLLFRSTNQTGDSFNFDLPTSQFPAGEYRILASVTNERGVVSIYAPAVIRLLGRLGGPVDMRTITEPNAPVRGAVFEGFNPRDNAGSLVASIPDIDGDGLDEILIVSQFGKPRYATNVERTGVGEAYLVYGRRQRFSGSINLNSTGTLVRGVIYPGVLEADNPIRPSRGITSFAVVSDWDNDGVRDFAFGVPFTDSLAITPLDSDGYFRSGSVVIASSQSLGTFGGGEVLNVSDFGVRAGPDDFQPRQCKHTFYGPKAPAFVGTGGTGFYRHIPIGIISPSWYGARISTVEFGDQCGESLSAYRCANFTDSCGLVISVPGRNPQDCVSTRPDRAGAGVVSVYYRIGGFNPWDLTNDTLPLEGPFLYILDDSRRLGVDAYGVVRPLSPGYVVYNEGNACPEVTSPFVPNPSRTARFYGGFPGARLAEGTAAGDINTDGVQDIIIGSPFSNDGNGSVFVVFGRLEALVLQTGVGAELDVEELGKPMDSSIPLNSRIFDGLRIVGGVGERLGQSLAAGGDFNGDGLDDIILGSPLVNNRRGGAAVFYGSRTVVNLTEREIPYAELPQRGLGVLFVGETDGDQAGMRVASAGDVDGDGYADILIAAPNRSVYTDLNADGIVDIDRTDCGVVYLVYGGPDLERRTTPGGQPGVLELRYCGTQYLPGAVFIGRNSGDELGAGIGEQGDRSHGIAVAGDVDGDGQKDFFLSSVRASPRGRAQAGEAYLIYGVGN